MFKKVFQEKRLTVLTSDSDTSNSTVALGLSNGNISTGGSSNSSKSSGCSGGSVSISSMK